MKLKYKYLFDKKFLDSLKYLSSLSLPSKQAVRLVRLVKDVYKEQTIAFTVRDRMMTEFGVSDFKDIEPIMEDINKKEEFKQNVRDLMEEEFEVSVDKITLPESVDISADMILILEQIIEV